MKTLLIREAEVRALLSISDAIDALESAFRRQDAGRVMNHSRRRLHAPAGTFHVMEAADLGLGRMAIKAYASFRPATRFLVHLYDTTNGDLLALIEADHLGRMRTGAATGVATRHMAREDSRTLGLFGSGGQAETQALAVAAVRPLSLVQVYSRSEEKRTSFARRMETALQAEVVPVDSPEKTLEGADIVVTATTARTPVFDGSRLALGTHVNAIGSNSLAKAEVDSETVTRSARVVVDSVEQSRLEAGDLLGPVEARRFRWEQARELHEVVAGRYPGRVDDEEITLFKSNGLALEDVAVASLIYDRARAQGIGQPISLWE